jgi:hypothetical protein
MSGVLSLNQGGAFLVKRQQLIGSFSQKEQMPFGHRHWQFLKMVLRNYPGALIGIALTLILFSLTVLA